MDEEANQRQPESENSAASSPPARSPYILEFVNVTDIPYIDNKVKSDPYLQAFIGFPVGDGDNIRYQKAGSTVRTPVRFDCTSVVWNCFRDMNVNPIQGSILSIELYHHHRDTHKSDHLLGTVDIPLSGLADEEPVTFPMINFKSGLEGKNPDFAVTVRRCFIDQPPPLYRTFYLIRHGQSKWNRAMARINITGLLDRDHALTGEGIQEALALNAKWRDVFLEDSTYNTMHSEENNTMTLPIFDFSRMDENEELALHDGEHSDSDDSDSDHDASTPVPGTSAPKSGGIGLGKLYDSFFFKKGTPSAPGTGPPSIQRDSSGVHSPALGSPNTQLPLVSPKNSSETVPPLATRRQSEVMSEGSVGIASHTSSFFSAEDAIATGLGPCIGEGLGLATMSGASAESSVSGRPGSASSNPVVIPVAARKFIYNSDSPSPSGSPSLEKCAAMGGFDSFAEGEVRADPFAGLGSAESSAFSPSPTMFSVPQDEAAPITSTSSSFVDTATLDKIFPPAEQLSLKNPTSCNNSAPIAPPLPPQMTRSRANSNVTPRGSITVNPIEAALDKPVIVTPFGTLSGLSVALAAADNASRKGHASQPPGKQEAHPAKETSSFRPTECVSPLTPLPIEREMEYFSPPSSMDASFHPTLPAQAEDDLVITPTVTQPLPMPSVAEENGTSGVAHSAYQELKSLEFPRSPNRADSEQLDSSQSGSIPTTLFQPSSPGFHPTLPDHHEHSHTLLDVLQDLGLARPPSKSLEDVFEDFPSVPIGDLSDVAFPLEIVVQADDPEEPDSARTFSLTRDEVRLLQINAALSPEQIAEIESVTSTEVDLPPPPDDADLPQRREEYVRLFLRADIVYSSPLTRAVQTALAAMCGHPALANNKLILYRPIREIKRIGGLDTVGIECGTGIVKRVRAELTSAVGAAKASELMDGVDVDTSGADVPWWTPISSFDNDKDQLERIREFISYSRYCPHPVPVFVGHSLFFRAFYSQRISAVMARKRPNLSANMKKYKLSNATLLAVTVKYHDLECGSSDAMILDADVLFGGGFHGARLVHQPPPEGSERGGDRGMDDAATIEALDIDGSLLLQEDGAGMQKIASSIQQASSSSSSAISKSVNIISSTISDLF